MRASQVSGEQASRRSLHRRSGHQIGVVAGMGCASRHLDVSPEVLASARPEVLERVRTNPYNYFRLVNREWTARVCEMLAADLPGQPVVQLHGDAHVEQFAYMRDAWGLTISTTPRGGWPPPTSCGSWARSSWSRASAATHDRDRIFDRFFDGYRRACMSDPAYQPPEPSVVRRHRAATTPTSREAFLGVVRGADETDTRGPTARRRRVDAGLERMRADRPDIPEGHPGRARRGSGDGHRECASPKPMARGSIDDPADDVLLEAKAVRSRGTAECLEQATSAPTFRIVEGSRRSDGCHRDLVAGPDPATAEVAVEGVRLSDWWILELIRPTTRSASRIWNRWRTSPTRLRCWRLGAGAVAADSETLRRQLAASIDQAEPWLRRAAEQLVGEMMRGWHGLGKR